MPKGVREEVLDDPLHLRGIQADDERFHVDGQVVSVVVFGLLDGAADQLAHLGRTSLR